MLGSGLVAWINRVMSATTHPCNEACCSRSPLLLRDVRPPQGGPGLGVHAHTWRVCQGRAGTLSLTVYQVCSAAVDGVLNARRQRHWWENIFKNSLHFAKRKEDFFF